MDAYKAIITKRDTRAYSDKPIADEVLRRILQAGRMAGSSKNTQPVRLVAVRDREWLKELATCGTFSQPLLVAQAGIAVCAAPDGSDFDAGRAAQNIMVAAWNEGVASCPTSVHDQPCIREKLGLPQDVEDAATGRKGWRAVVIIALGYPQPGAPMSMGRARVPMGEYVSWEKWGQGDAGQ
ncbi:MAG: nitroreductase family protein [Dehalococcoidia bacterium]|nr:nitroreductase family protein [Dehalococcoidia bacterium]